MKVLHVSTYDMGGAGIAATRIHQSLLKIGVSSKLLCLNKESKHVPEVYLWRNNKSLFSKICSRLGLVKSASKKNSVALSSYNSATEMFSFPTSDYNINNHPLVQEADIIHLHWVSNFIDFDSLFARGLQKPVVWTTHDLNPVMGGFHYENDIARNPHLAGLDTKLREYKHSLIKKSRIAFVGVSNWTTEKNRKYLGDDVTYNTIYNPINFYEFAPVSKPVAQEALGILNNRDRKIVIGLGAQHLNNYRKGIDIIVEAYSKLNNYEKESIQFVSFGAVLPGNLAIGEVKQFGTVENTILLSLIYSSMDLFIIPSREEALGLTGVEALSCGTPLLGSNVGGIKDYLVDHVNGIFFQPGNPEDLAEKLKLLIDRRELLSLFAENARNSVLENFSDRTVGEQYLQVYRSLV